MSARSQIAILGRRAGLSDTDAEGLAEQLLDAHRAEVLAEAKEEAVAWLAKKARERRSMGRQYTRQADLIAELASKADRGAIRIFHVTPKPEATS